MKVDFVRPPRVLRIASAADHIIVSALRTFLSDPVITVRDVPKQEEYLGYITRLDQRAAAIINNILDSPPSTPARFASIWAPSISSRDHRSRRPKASGRLAQPAA